jgi:pSer/pThr/pTyr-binding forkhead associated (FHA) protein
MRFKLVSENDPNTVYETGQREFALGRSKDCEITINDPHISRVQARVRYEGDRFYIENLGQNPVLINGLGTRGQFLNDGDQITMGTTNLRFHPERPHNETPHPIAVDEKTIAVASLPEQVLGPRLVLTSETGETKTYPINKVRIVIGRTEDADISLQDPSVSRQHGLIEKKENAYFVKKLSHTNPLYLNDEAVTENHLYSGDHLRIGSFFLTFISDRPEDATPVEEKIITEKKGPGWALWLAAASLLLIVGSFLFYRHAYYPWKINRSLDAVAEQVAAAEYQAAQDSLRRLLAKGLPPAEARKARELMTQSALGIVQNLADTGRLQEAERYLADYLDEYGGGKESATLREHLDTYRVEIARSLEAASQNQAALRRYAMVPEGSPVYSSAQQGIRRIWLVSQQERRRDQNLDQLLQEAELHFKAKRYLTPVNNNAYSVYQTILATEPDNAVALERIEQIKTFYRLAGERYFKKKQWKRALTYFERHNFIAPETQDIQQKIDICRAKITASKPSGNRKQVEKILDESGIESSRIIKFLYEDQSGENDTEKPW